jgi:3-phytase
MKHLPLRPRAAALILVALLASACSEQADTADTAAAPVAETVQPAAAADSTANAATAGPATPAAQPARATVAEAFLTEMVEADNIDSPAVWQHPDGATWVIATAKAADQLLVYDGDTGATLQRVGSRGDAPGQFRRPNGVFVIDDLLLLVERDNRRVQVLRLPAFEPVASFGEDVLVKPYGIWAQRGESGIDLYVTDAYMAGEDAEGEDILPPLEELDERVKRFALREQEGALRGDFVGSFGDTSPAGALRVVESIWGDSAQNRLLIAEEDETYANEFKVYDLDGQYAGRTFGGDMLKAQAEGITLFACTDGSGYWLTTEQDKGLTVFHLFDRATLDHVGAFTGEQVANTDGIWLQQQGTTAFPSGAFYAVHDDQGMVGFDWRAIAQATGVMERCPAS